MPWVNIFEHEACTVVIGLMSAANDWPPEPENVFSISKNPVTPQYFDDSHVVDIGLYANAYNIDGPAIGVPDVEFSGTLTGMYIIPSGGIAGRRFRARMLQQTSSYISVGPDAGIIMCPGYFVEGCGWTAAYDEAALVPINLIENPPADSEWYEFEVVAAEPDAGGLENTGWVGLFNYDPFGWYINALCGFFEWQVWVDGPEPSACFWTDIVNATQECDGEGPPDPPSGDWYVLVTRQNNNEAYVLTLNDDGVSEEPEAEFTLPGASSGVRTPYFSPSGDSLAVGNTAGSSASISGFSYDAKAPTGEITPPSGFFGSQGVSTVRFSPGGGAVAAVSNGYNAPMLEAYRWEDATFGDKYSPPTIPPQSGSNTFRGGNALAFSPNGDAIVVGTAVAPYIAAYPWSDSGGFGVKHANPSVAPTSTRFALEFSVTGAALFTTGYDSSGISAFAFDPATGFGAKYSAPATLPAGNPAPYQKSLAVCPDNRAVALAHVGSPYVSVWRWNDVTGFGEKYANPSSLPENAKGVEFTPDGKFLIVTGVFVGSTSYTYVYKWDSEDGFGDLFVFEGASISSAVLRPPVG